MKRAELKSLIRQILLEIQNSEPNKDKEEDDNIDADIESEPLGDDEVWPGSDIAGSKVGGTSFPHGFGHPGAKKRKGKFDREFIQKTVNLNYINGVSEEEQMKESKRDQKVTYDFIRKNCPSLLKFYYRGDYNKEEKYFPFVELFTNRNLAPGWRNYMIQTVIRHRDFLTHWRDFDKKELKRGAKYNHHWASRWYDAYRIFKQFPTIEEEFNKVLDFLDKLEEHSVDNPKNPSNYPLFVSLYDVTRRLGGPEEGGWWYDKEDAIHSIKVNDYKSARKAAVQLLHLINQADLDGKPQIVLEKEEGHIGNQPTPKYG